MSNNNVKEIEKKILNYLYAQQDLLSELFSSICELNGSSLFKDLHPSITLNSKKLDGKKVREMLNNVKSEYKKYENNKDESTHIFNEIDDKCERNNLSKSMGSEAFAKTFGDKSGVVERCIERAKKSDKKKCECEKQRDNIERFDNLCSMFAKQMKKTSMSDDRIRKLILGYKLYALITLFSGRDVAVSFLERSKDLYNQSVDYSSLKTILQNLVKDSGVDYELKTYPFDDNFYYENIETNCSSFNCGSNRTLTFRGKNYSLRITVETNNDDRKTTVNLSTNNSTMEVTANTVFTEMANFVLDKKD